VHPDILISAKLSQLICCLVVWVWSSQHCRPHKKMPLSQARLRSSNRASQLAKADITPQFTVAGCTDPPRPPPLSLSPSFSPIFFPLPRSLPPVPPQASPLPLAEQGKDAGQLPFWPGSRLLPLPPAMSSSPSGPPPASSSPVGWPGLRPATTPWNHHRRCPTAIDGQQQRLTAPHGWPSPAIWSKNDMVDMRTRLLFWFCLGVFVQNFEPFCYFLVLGLVSTDTG
jgi:hypothetical protein